MSKQSFIKQIILNFKHFNNYKIIYNQLIHNLINVFKILIKNIRQYIIIILEGIKIHEQFLVYSSAYQINNKKRQKEQQLLKIERSKIQKQLKIQQERLKIQIHPMTMLLNTKKSQLDRLRQTKQIIQDYSQLIKQSQEEANIFPLDQKNLKNSALKIFVFKTIFDQSKKGDHTRAKMRIDKKYAELKHKIFQNFKQGFIKKQQYMIMNALPYCQEYNLLDDVSDFYNNHAFGSVSTNQRINEQNWQKIITNFFFLLGNGFTSAFSVQTNQQQLNFYQIHNIFKKDYTEMMSKRLITFAFQKLIKQTITNALNMAYSSQLYLSYLQCFYKECKNLITKAQTLIVDQKISHLMSTYFESIFDAYLQIYLKKQLNNLSIIYTQYAQKVAQEIKQTDQLLIPRQQAPQQKSVKGFKKLLTDYKIQQKPVVTMQQIDKKVQKLLQLFTMNANIQKIFDSTKKSLNRNNKIAKFNQVDKNRNQILALFFKHIGQIIQILIKSISGLIPKFNDKLILHNQFFELLPNVMMILQRMQFLYEQYKKQAKYQFSQTIKLQQKKQSLLQKCQKQFYNTIGQALASLLSIQSDILRSDPKAYEGSMKQGSQVGIKVAQYLQKYLKSINKMTLLSFRNSIMKMIGDQFIKLLIDFYSRVKYTSQGKGKIFLDFNAYKKIISQIDDKEIDRKFKNLYYLVDIYVMKNDQRQINQNLRLKRQEDPNFRLQNEQIIKKFIQNKQKNQKI